MWVFRYIFTLIDGAVYWMINAAYTLFMDIANAEIFDQEILSAFSNRIYAFLGIFMLFKIAFSLIKYIINPDEFNDSNKGGKKLITNIIMCLFFIIITPFVFRFAWNFQKQILKENIIPSIIMGVKGNESYDVESIGKTMSKTILTAFYYPECTNGIIEVSEDGNSLLNECPGFDEEDQKDYLEALRSDDINEVFYTGSSTALYRLKDGDDEYVMHYSIVVSTAVGIVTALLLITFCFQIAIRTIKFGFLQLIAPLAIVSYVDPKSSQDGFFAKWLKECGKTYIDLFIRLAAIFFAVLLISIISSSVLSYSVEDAGIIKNFLVKVFLILGALAFAEQLPKLIENLLGVELSGNFSLNPLKAVGSSKFASAALGAATVGVGSAIGNAVHAHKDEKKPGEVLKSSLSGLTRGLYHGGRAGATSNGGSFRDTFEQGMISQANARNLREDPNTRYGLRARMKDKLTDLTGIKFQSGTSSQLKDQLNLRQRDYDNARMREESTSRNFANKLSETGVHYGDLNRIFDDAYDAQNGQYVERTYNDYLKMKADQIGYDTSSIDSRNLEAKEYAAALSSALSSQNVDLYDQGSFDELKAIYDSKHEWDNRTKDIEKEINDIKDNMDSVKGK